MSGQWKPGDVLTWRNISGDSVVGIVSHRGRLNGFDVNGSAYTNRDARYARPLVVIDPEDAEAVERLAGRIGHLWTSYHRVTEVVQAALREFANPTPPKPDEPQGLGAVVRDAKGYLYSRGYPEQTDDFAHVWHVVDRAANLPRSWWKWDEIDAVEVLSEGVTP